MPCCVYGQESAVYKFLRPLLFLFSPDRAHQLTLWLLRLIPLWCLRRMHQSRILQPIDHFGLHFDNPLGVAAGFDKNAHAVDALFALGFGFVEVGAVTPKPQKGNPRPHMTRLKYFDSVLNRCGFNNHGVDALVGRLQKRRLPGVLGVNIGANTATANQDALHDYVYCLQRIYQYVDFITINVSCPNSSQLTDLQQSNYLNDLLSGIVTERDRLAETSERKPLLVKVSPDLSRDEIKSVADALLMFELDGVVTTNTTKFRDGVSTDAQAGLTGGLSGSALYPRSLHTQQLFREYLPDDFPIIAVGGIDNAARALERMEQGACLLQVYTGLVYQGPGLIKTILNGL